MSPLIISLTGGIGSGKSTVTELFAAHNIAIIDADKIAHDIVQTESAILNKIAAKLGAAVLDAERRLNRAAVREIIFRDIAKRKWLECLLHPLIRSKMQQQTEQACSPYCIQVIPLLTKRDNQCGQRILVVDSSEAAQISRVLKRDHINAAQAQAILNAQITRQQRLAIADDVIVNDNDTAHLKQQIDKLHKFYLNLAEGHLYL